jgi:RHS repeat-associated protein
MFGWNLGGRPVAVYTLAPGDMGNIISVRRSTTDYFYHYDRMGNVLFLTDTAGNKAAEYVMEGFGNTIYSSGSVTDNHRLSTKEYDSNSGLYYFMARWYYPKTGNFLSKDPIPSINPYPYCGQNPINRIDPQGLKWAEINWYWFVYHFFFGLGETVDIRNIGIGNRSLIDIYQEAPSVQRVVKKAQERVWVRTMSLALDNNFLINSSVTENLNGKGNVNLTNEGIFILGKGVLNFGGKCHFKKQCGVDGRVCVTSRCINVKFWQNDEFTDPYDLVEKGYLKKESWWANFGGTPYDIYAEFSRYLGCTVCK